MKHLRKVCMHQQKRSPNKDEFVRCLLIPNEVMTIRKWILLSPAVACIMSSILNNKNLHQMGHDLARIVFDIKNNVNHNFHNNIILSQGGIDLLTSIPQAANLTNRQTVIQKNMEMQREKTQTGQQTKTKDSQ